MKKHTIKLLTVAITLATILTLTGCPGPVTPDRPCTHEHTRTEVIEEATCSKEGLGKVVCADCEEVLDEQKTLPIDPENHDWVLEDEETHRCITHNNITAHHTFIAGGCDECGAYKYSGTQVEVYVYIFNEEKELNDLGILYYSFEETDKTMELNNLLHLKPKYKDYTVAYCIIDGFSPATNKDILTSNGRYDPWEESLKSPIGIIIEPQTN